MARGRAVVCAVGLLAILTLVVQDLAGQAGFGPTIGSARAMERAASNRPASTLAASGVLTSPTATATATPVAHLHLPIVYAEARNLAYPDLAMAERTWIAAERLEATYLDAEVFPAYAPERGGPSAENVASNVEAACHDFPDLPEPFGEGAHHRACYAWVAANRAQWHAARAYRSTRAPAGAAFALDDEKRRVEIAWAQHYLDAQLQELIPFVYGPEDLDEGQPSYRDTLAGLWQNVWRGADVAIAANILHRMDALPPETESLAAELMSAVVRSWYAAYRVEGKALPNTGVPFTASAWPEIDARSLAGKQVAPTFAHTYTWDADKGTRGSQAEEVSWSGAAAMLIARSLENRLEDGRNLYYGGQRWVDFSLVYDRYDARSGDRIRSLNSETEGGPYGQRKYWLENHTDDVPSIPYVGYTWLAIGAAHLSWGDGGRGSWPSFAPNDEAWDILLKSAGETMRAPDGTLLVDFRPGQGIGYDMSRTPDWAMPCGRWIAGRHYVHYDGRAGGPELFVSEIGHPAGLDVMNMAWPIMRVAAARGDTLAYEMWSERLRLVLEEYTARPPSPYWTECQIAPYVSENPGYHGARMLSGYVLAYMGLSGFQIEPWE